MALTDSEGQSERAQAPHWHLHCIAATCLLDILGAWDTRFVSGGRARLNDMNAFDNRPMQSQRHPDFVQGLSHTSSLAMQWKTAAWFR